MITPRYQIKTILITTTAIALLSTAATWYFDIPHGPVEKIPSLHGQTYASLMKQLGNPSFEYSFTMDKRLSEFQIELHNTYPPESPNNPTVEIRECTWEYSRHRLTVWFHKMNGKWLALNTSRYKNDVVF